MLGRCRCGAGPRGPVGARCWGGKRALLLEGRALLLFEGRALLLFEGRAFDWVGAGEGAEKGGVEVGGGTLAGMGREVGRGAVEGVGRVGGAREAV